MSDANYHKSRFGDSHAGGPMRRGRRGGGGGGRRGESFAGGGGGGGGGRHGGHHGESRDENKPCRSLFVRNIQFDASEQDLRRVFEPYGDIKEIYSRIHDRGIVFIHYYDLRAAERAKEDCGNISISGRDLDIHYSFPKDDIRSVKCDETKNQGTLLLSLNGTEENLVDDELYEQFQKFGDVKVIRTPNFKTYSENTARWQRLLEYYDSRAAVSAAKATHGKEYKTGVWDVNFFWDQGLKGSSGGRDGSPARRSDRFKRHEPYPHHRHDHDQRQGHYSPPSTRTQLPYASGHPINTVVPQPPQPPPQMAPGEPALDNAQKAQRLLSLLSQLQTVQASSPAQAPPPVPVSMGYPLQASAPPPPQANEGVQQLLGLLTQVALNSRQQPPAIPLQQQQQQQQIYTQYPRMDYPHPPAQALPTYPVQNQYTYLPPQQQPLQQQPLQRQEPQDQLYSSYPQYATRGDVSAGSSPHPPHIPYNP